MAKDPAFLFYVSDFLTGTMLMNNEQVGIYMRLLCVQHQHGGFIDKVSFKSMVNGQDIIRIKFIETKEGFYNKRMMDEMVKRKKKSENLSANAMVRWDKDKQKQCKSNAKASSLHMPTKDRDKDVNKDKKETAKKNILVFESLWNKYPRKDGKKEALRHFVASVKTDQDVTDINTALGNYIDTIERKKTEQKFIKNGSTWFDNWRDWITVEEKKEKAWSKMTA